MPTEICEAGEMFDECANQLCENGQPITCRDVQMGLVCTESEECLPGCICQNGTVRDENGDCVPVSMCNSCYLPNGQPVPAGERVPGDTPCEIW